MLDCWYFKAGLSKVAGVSELSPHMLWRSKISSRYYQRFPINESKLRILNAGVAKLIQKPLSHIFIEPYKLRVEFSESQLESPKYTKMRQILSNTSNWCDESDQEKWIEEYGLTLNGFEGHEKF